MTQVTLEDTLLRELSSSQGNILDNQDLIETLENTKQKAVEIAAKLKQAEITKSDIGVARSVYNPVAKRYEKYLLLDMFLMKLNVLN
jgi:dynein heavy chain